jgi:hypothetical protein
MDLEHLTASGDDRVVPTACLERIFTPSMRSQDSVPFSAFSKISRVSMAYPGLEIVDVVAASRATLRSAIH